MSKSTIWSRVWKNRIGQKLVHIQNDWFWSKIMCSGDFMSFLVWPHFWSTFDHRGTPKSWSSKIFNKTWKVLNFTIFYICKNLTWEWGVFDQKSSYASYWMAPKKTPRTWRNIQCQEGWIIELPRQKRTLQRNWQRNWEPHKRVHIEFFELTLILSRSSAWSAKNLLFWIKLL